jgi:hypothetical protein
VPASVIVRRRIDRLRGAAGGCTARVGTGAGGAGGTGNDTVSSGLGVASGSGAAAARGADASVGFARRRLRGFFVRAPFSAAADTSNVQLTLRPARSGGILIVCFGTWD